jgi:hypothetical protein
MVMGFLPSFTDKAPTFDGIPTVSANAVRTAGAMCRTPEMSWWWPWAAIAIPRWPPTHEADLPEPPVHRILSIDMVCGDVANGGSATSQGRRGHHGRANTKETSMAK